MGQKRLIFQLGTIFHLIQHVQDTPYTKNLNLYIKNTAPILKWVFFADFDPVYSKNWCYLPPSLACLRYRSSAYTGAFKCHSSFDRLDDQLWVSNNRHTTWSKVGLSPFRSRDYREWQPPFLRVDSHSWLITHKIFREWSFMFDRLPCALAEPKPNRPFVCMHVYVLKLQEIWKVNLFSDK